MFVCPQQFEEIVSVEEVKRLEKNTDNDACKKLLMQVLLLLVRMFTIINEFILI